MVSLLQQQIAQVIKTDGNLEAFRANQFRIELERIRPQLCSFFEVASTLVYNRKVAHDAQTVRVSLREETIQGGKGLVQMPLGLIQLIRIDAVNAEGVETGCHLLIRSERESAPDSQGFFQQTFLLIR